MSTKFWNCAVILLIVVTLLIVLKFFATKTIFYGVFYFFLTLFFIYIFVKEKKLAEIFDARREKYVSKIVKKYDIKNENKIKNIKKTFYYIEAIGTALILVVIIQRFYIGNFKIPTGSMISTIEIGDRVFADMVSYKFTTPKRNSIIVFKEPIQNKVLYTKRAMGLPGEKIKIEDNILYINGEETGPILDFIHDKKILDKLMAGETVEITLEDNYYLALGDNTDNSFDSRYWGFVKESRIRGRALVRFWPLSRIGLLDDNHNEILTLSASALKKLKNEIDKTFDIGTK